MMYSRCCQLLLLVAMTTAYYYPMNDSPEDRSYGFGKELNDYLDQDSSLSNYYQRDEDSYSNEERYPQHGEYVRDDYPSRSEGDDDGYEEAKKDYQQDYAGDGKDYTIEGDNDDVDDQDASKSKVKYESVMKTDMENIKKNTKRDEPLDDDDNVDADLPQLDENFENTMSADMDDLRNSYHDDQRRDAPKDSENESYSDPGVSTHIANWWNTFDHGGWSKCAQGTYLTGLWRSAHKTLDERIGRIEQGDCKSAPSNLVGSSKGQDCYKLNLWQSFDRKGWGQCKPGYYIQSIFSTRGRWLHHIEEFMCCKPKDNKVAQGRCHVENVWKRFDHKGWSKCKAGTYMTGIFRNSCNKLYCIEEFKCCEMKKNKDLSSGGMQAPGKVLVTIAKWWRSIRQGGWSSCSAGTYITGFWRASRPSSRIDHLGRLQVAQCKSAPLNWAHRKLQRCYKLNIWRSFERRGWGRCRSGYYMSAMFTTRGRNLHNIEEFNCCRPMTRKVIRGKCYIQNVSKSLDKKGWSKCKKGYYMAGIWRNRCDWLHCIDYFTCCQMKYV